MGYYIRTKNSELRTQSYNKLRVTSQDGIGIPKATHTRISNHGSRIETQKKYQRLRNCNP